MLPLIADTPCTACRGPCCVGRSVPLTAFDLNRLADNFGVPWHELALAGVAFSGGFRLDATTTRWGFRLRQRPGGSCLLAVGGEYLRCAAHAVLPGACRIYPFYVGLGETGVRVGLGNNAACPPSLGMAWAALAAPERVEADIAEHHRYQQLIERWEAQITGKHQLDEFLTFARENP